MNSTSGKRKVLLVGWDAADWEHINPLLDEGLLPTLESVINRGVMGNLATLQPMLSPMLWNSIATGKFPDKHGIHGFIEPDPVNGGARPYTSTSRQCKALWNIFTQAGLRSNVVGWWASHPAEPINGNVVTNAFGGVKFDPENGWIVPPGSIHPAEKGPQLARFKVFPSELTEAHILPFIPEAAKVDQRADPRLATFAKVLSDAATIHAVATTLMETEPWDFSAVYYDAVDHFSHAFMPYHPPRLPWVEEADFEMFKGVVTGAYRFHDMMLERLLDLAGPETTVIICSDHGFESGSQRPRAVPREPAGPAAWHRQYGIVVIAGPGIKQDERIYGASLVDIAPTILSLFELPLGEDMDGRPLIEAFESAPAIETIPSWEEREGDAGMHPPGKTIDSDQAAELMEQFAALGYIENPGEDKEKASESADIEAKYNLARTYSWKQQPERALPLLTEIVERRPWEDRFLHALASCYLHCGYLRQAERVTLAISDGSEPHNPTLLLLLAKIRLRRGDIAGGLQAVLAAETNATASPRLLLQIGDAYSSLSQLDKARSAYEGAIALDPENALALQGLSNVYRRLGLNQETVDTALHAVSLLHRLPTAHFNIGVAMARSGDNQRATLAFETALRFMPEMPNAHRFLAALYRQQGDAEKAEFHQLELARISRKRRSARTVAQDREEKILDLPEIPSSAVRHEILLRERPDPKKTSERSGKTFILVSGLPRSGTSLMMQMLEAGGVRIVSDGERTADVDNPQGYYEWEPIKQIGRKPELLDEDELNGRAIKCISMLLPQMPEKHDYKVIFMTRPIDEVVASQRSMIERRGTSGAALESGQLARELTVHRNEIRRWLATNPNFHWVEINYPSLVASPETAVQTLTAFLGESLTTPERMATVIKPALHRQRVTAK